MTQRTSGLTLLQDVATRIITKHLTVRGATRAEVVAATGSHGLGVDIVAIEGRVSRRIKLKADPYFGTDSRKIGDRGLEFYRADSGCLAFEAVANTSTRELGWTLTSEAEDLYYYYLALGQSPDEVRALLAEPDEVFYSEIAVERDELLILPMDRVRTWFEEHNQDYAPRPVMHDGVASWYRLVPRADLEKPSGGFRVPERSSLGSFSETGAGPRRASVSAVEYRATEKRYARHRGNR